MNFDIFAISEGDPSTDLENFRNRVVQVPKIVLASKEPMYKNMATLTSSMTSDCLCKSIAPLINLAQFFGVIPLVNDSIHDQGLGNKQGAGVGGQQCVFSFRFSSLPNLTNYFSFVLYAFSVVWCYLYIRDTLVDDFQGTDLYAHEFKVDTTVVAGTVIILVFRLKYDAFIKCVRVLSSVWSSLGGLGLGRADDDEGEASRVGIASKLSTPSSLSKIGAGLICLNFLLSGLVGTFRFGVRYSLLEAPTLYVVQVVGLSGLTGLQQCVAFIFAMLCWITKSLFVKLSEQLRLELGTGAATSGGTRNVSGHKLEQIRLLHNALCKSNNHLSSYFGLPVLGICCTGIIAITCGIYNFIFSEETLFDGFDEQLSIKKLYYVMFVFEMYFAVLAIGLILVSGQLLSNSVSSCIDAIHECNLVDLDEKSEFQVMVCLQSIKASSGKLTASNMATIGMGFIASAVTNTTTYILVLLQFRLGGGDDSEASDGGAALTTTLRPT